MLKADRIRHARFVVGKALGNPCPILNLLIPLVLDPIVCVHYGVIVERKYEDTIAADWPCGQEEDTIPYQTDGEACDRQLPLINERCQKYERWEREDNIGGICNKDEKIKHESGSEPQYQRNGRGSRPGRHPCRNKHPTSDNQRQEKAGRICKAWLTDAPNNRDDEAAIGASSPWTV
jgi:hypothetical protein